MTVPDTNGRTPTDRPRLSPTALDCSWWRRNDAGERPATGDTLPEEDMFLESGWSRVVPWWVWLIAGVAIAGMLTIAPFAAYLGW